MWKRKWLWCAVAAVPLLAAGAWAGVRVLGDGDRRTAAPAPARTCCESVCPLCEPGAKTAAEVDCCADPTCPPGCCPECPPNCLDLAGKAQATAKSQASVKTDCPPCWLCP
jgi:hypothetical protein